MIKCYLDDKTLLVQFTTTELDHHVANYIRENVDDIIMRKNIKNIIFRFREAEKWEIERRSNMNIAGRTGNERFSDYLCPLQNIRLRMKS